LKIQGFNDYRLHAAARIGYGLCDSITEDGKGLMTVFAAGTAGYTKRRERIAEAV
jgi:hypothetical protein